ncbi:ATP-binding cassette domain-containing protein [Sulfurimonas autotrophica]|uniref:ABC transporter related protein n=1 Tax=Sulfurimonas autotrophica (strain ATCC BAA-671 / DSM 16294 / JCM 11897 / OK10) TaxID=563040 RepID=E0UTK0_SULAO|nr:ATP-binding cassette domain-containing protein [Sulfurimonas autotrophica]ADN09365.1 ABC transporter related protein [Sulfurimonas autotrophica DSM 16294]
MSILEVKNVTVTYKKRVGIKNASLQANSGEIIGFIGADGAGKSSLMHAIAGVIRFDGEVVYNNIAYHSPKEAEQVKPFIGLMPQGIGLVLYDTLTVGEHLQFFADIRDVKKDEKFMAYREKLLHMAGLSDFVNREAGKLSGGMMQKLSLICTLLHRPKLLILDEPTTGVDPLSRLELWEILDTIRKEEGTVILVSTAYMQEASKMDKILLFDEGEIIARGTNEELLDSIRPYVYEQSDCTENCLAFNKRTYSLEPLHVKQTEPTLEGLFFVNALQKKKLLPKIDIVKRDEELEMPQVVMQAKGITKRFGNFTANDHVDIELKRGEILGLLGANGAGKTTFIKMLLGLYSIDDGELTLLDKVIHSGLDRRELKSKIGYVSQHFALYNDMTVRENLIYFANMHRLPIDTALKRIEEYANELGFKEYMDDLPTALPLGVNQRFSIAAALLHEPLVLFLDEPTSGVDTIARAQFWEILRKLKEQWNISILITTHYMSEAEYCDRVVLLKQGKKIADDTIENLYQSHPDANTFEDIFLSYYKDIS